MFSCNNFTGCALAPMGLPLLSQAGGALLSLGAVKDTALRGMESKCNFIFGENEIAEQSTTPLNKVNNFAIWPESAVDVRMAQELASKKIFLSVITPSKTSRILKKHDLSSSLKGMIESEKMEAFQIVCQASGAEALIFFKNKGHHTKKNTFSLKQAAHIFENQMFIYSAEADKVIYSALTTLTIGQGQNIPGSVELAEMLGPQLADKIAQLKKQSPHIVSN